jgi:cell division protein FtsW
LIFSIIGLILVLIPGIGKHINGAKRWIGLGFIHLQVSEFAKLAMMLYLSSYLTRRHYELIESSWGFFKPLLVLVGLTILLLLEPDFGATTVIIIVSLGMMFLAGAPLDKFFCILAIAILMLVTLVAVAPYRLARVLNFLNPWEHAYSGGYQLTQALMAFGRGEVFGVGLGNSVQKMFYLPEAHTDFLFAVIGEELGLVGCAFVILCYVALVARVLYLSRWALTKNMYFHSYLCSGIALWLSFQSFVNIGVNIGLLPTKGLTLPFISYGGSSLFVSSIVFALLVRISYEIRVSKDSSPRHINKYKSGKVKRRKKHAKV